MAPRLPVVLALLGLAFTLSAAAEEGTPLPTADFVSQNVEGKLVSHATVNGTDTPMVSATLTLYLDIDTMNIRQDNIADPVTLPNKSTMSATTGEIVDWSAKKITVLYLDTLDGKTINKHCNWSTIARMPPAVLVRTFFKSKLKNTTASRMDGEWGVFEIKGPVPNVSANVDITVELDSSNVVHKWANVNNITQNGTKATTTSIFTATSAKGGKPDASHFQVPSSWGPCVESPAPPPAAMPHLHQALTLLMAASVPEAAASEKVTMVV